MKISRLGHHVHDAFMSRFMMRSVRSTHRTSTHP
jgi:hypothetical protein